MPHLILVRHGQSEWNLEKRFTGWVDVDLTGQGKLEACKSGEYIKELKLNIDYFYSSFQLRAINTLKIIKDTLRDNRATVRAWQLNERHYGALTGLNKDEMRKKLGEDKIHEFYLHQAFFSSRLYLNQLMLRSAFHLTAMLSQ